MYGHDPEELGGRGAVLDPGEDEDASSKMSSDEDKDEDEDGVDFAEY